MSVLNRFGAGVALMVVSAVGSTTLAAKQFGAVSVQVAVVLGAWFLLVTAYMVLGASRPPAGR